MQPSYRPSFQTPQRSPHVAASSSRRGIGPMVSGHPAGQMTSAQIQAQQVAEAAAINRAKMKSRKPIDKTMPEGVEDYIIGDGVEKYKQLRDVERRLDSTIMRKRLDIQEAVNRNVKQYRTLRIWISNTVEDQPWQADTLDVDAFDFSSSIDSSYRVKIEGRLLDEEDDGLDSESEDEDEPKDPDAMDEDNKEQKKKLPTKQYKFSHFFKVMTVDFDRNKIKDGQEHSVEWKKPTIGPNATNLPNAADFDQLEFKRGGDDNINITINLTRDENPERFQLSPLLADILDTQECTRAEAVAGIWDYIRVMGLQEDDEKRSFECNGPLRHLFRSDKGYIPQIPEVILPHMTTLPPIKLPYTIRVDKTFHENPTPTTYDVQVQVDDPLLAALQVYLTNPAYAKTLRDIAAHNDHLSLLIQKISQSKVKHAFFDGLLKNPVEFIKKWISSQERDLEIIGGEGTRGGGEDATADEWRRGGPDGIWGSQNLKESVNLIVGAKAKV